MLQWPWWKPEEVERGDAATVRRKLLRAQLSVNCDFISWTAEILAGECSHSPIRGHPRHPARSLQLEVSTQ